MALRLEKGERIEEIRDVAGTTVKEEISRWSSSPREDCLVIPGFAEVSTDKRKYAQAFALHYQEQDPFHGRAVVQPHPKTVIIQNPPARPLRTEELDRIYELPFAREAHPSYREPIPALEPVRFSITSHRGCFGSCSFCALTHHQGRIVQSRSEDSILREATRLTKMKGFHGIISDVGGPTANMYGLSCPRWKKGACSDKLCSADCASLDKDHSRQVDLAAQAAENSRSEEDLHRLWDQARPDNGRPFPLSGGALPASRLRSPQDSSRAHLPVGDRSACISPLARSWMPSGSASPPPPGR